METIHILTLDIYNANLRHCKEFQEKIVDSFDDGRLKVAWDVIKENYFLRGDPMLEEICFGCPLNIYMLQQGCEGEVYNLNLFLNFLKIHFPDSIILKHNFTNIKLSFDQAHEMRQELEEISRKVKKIKWPAAEVYFEGSAVMLPAKDEKEEVFFYPWLGAEEKYFLYGNEAYRFGITQNGIVIQRAFVEIPNTFKHLWKKEGKTYGKTNKDEVIVFETEMGILPTWDPADESRDSDLVFKEIGGDAALRYIIDTLKAFLDIAIKHYIGITVSEVL